MTLILALALSCTPISVTDGDTFRAACPEPVTVRIANIDAPAGADCPRDAARSADTLAALLTGTLTVQPLYLDRWGRTVATVTAQGQDVGQTLLDAGAAKEWLHDRKGRAKERRPKWRGCR
jgi:endonuclease YncB( thermonuclease family)